MRVVSTVFALAVSLMIAGNLLAADEPTAPEGRHGHRRPMMGQGDVFPAAMLKGLNLTDDQKAKVKALKGVRPEAKGSAGQRSDGGSEEGP